MYLRIVTLKVGLLLEAPVADAADVFGRLTTLVVEMTFQAALVSVGSTALVAREWFRQEILAPWR